MNGSYFDYCATTPLHPAVREAMLPTLEDVYGNPSSMHLFGRKAKDRMELSRKQVAAGLGAASNEIVFTSGATEANNLALIGSMKAQAPQKNHLVVSAIEHHAVLHTAQALEERGFEVTRVPVDGEGFIALEDVEKALRPDTGLVSIMMVNNEVGSVQEIAQIGELVNEHGALFHTDAVQAANCFEIDVDALNVDLLSLSAHKMYGPKGIGALYIRNGTEITPLLFGGSQEHSMRPGTENIPGIVGLGAAMRLRNDEYALRHKRLTQLRRILIEGFKKRIPEASLNGPQDQQFAPHIISVTFPEVDGELLLFHLSKKGIAVSMGSACTAEEIEPSHVLIAMGISRKSIEGTLRISIGDPTTEEEIKGLLDLLPDAIEQSRLAPLIR